MSFMLSFSGQFQQEEQLSGSLQIDGSLVIQGSLTVTADFSVSGSVRLQNNAVLLLHGTICI